VVNITTKRPTAPFSGHAGVEYGSYATARGWGSVLGLQGPFEYRVSLSGAHSHGYSDFNYVSRYAVTDDVELSFGADATRESMEQHSPGFASANPDMSSDFWKNGAFDGQPFLLAWERMTDTTERRRESL